MNKIYLKTILVFLCVLAISTGFSQITQTFTTTTNWTCPAGVTSVDVTCWGGGGGGGGTAAAPNSGGGGAGGSCSKSTITVIPGTSYVVTVGAAGTAGSNAGGTGGTGGDSWFNTNTTILAKGGIGGVGGTVALPTGTGGLGSASGNIGTAFFAGGNGADATATTSGAGGGAGGTTAAGGNAGGTTAGTGGATGGGNGGAGRSAAGAGTTGVAPGGGGGGGYRTTTALRAGGAGGAGRVVLNYTCPAATLPYTMPIGTPAPPAIPECTSLQNINGDAFTWQSFSGLGSIGGFTPPTLGYSYNTNSITAANDWLFTTTLNLTAGVSYRVSYKFGNDGGTTYPENMKVAYGTANNAAAMTNLLADHPSITGAPQTAFADFIPSASGTYYIGFHAYSAADEDVLLLDDIVVSLTPSCLGPSALNASNITVTGADINFTPPASAPANGYDYFFNTTNTAPTGSSTPDGNTAASPAVLSGLQSSMVYYVWIRSKCSLSDLSMWTGPYIFNTTCAAQNIPYTMPIGSLPPPAIPVCTSNEDINADLSTWKTYDASSFGATISAAYTFPVLSYIYNSSNAANDWIYTNGLNLTAGTSYRLSFKYSNDLGSSFPEKMKVAYGSGNNAAAMTTVLADYPSITGSAVQTVSIDFTPAATGVYYIGFQAYSDADEDVLVLDDVAINLAPLCAGASAVTVGSITGSSASVTFTGSGNILLEYGPAGFTPGTGLTAGVNGIVIDPAASPQSISGLAQSTTYDVYLRQNCTVAGNGFSANSPKVTFSTAVPNDECANAVVLTQSTVYDAACTGVSGTTAGATLSSLASNCFFTSNDDDVWYSFTATSDRVLIRLSDITLVSGIMPDAMGFTLISNCSSATDICDIASITNGKSEININSLTVGTNYILRILTNGSTGRVNFNICVTVPKINLSTPNTCVTGFNGSISASGSSNGWIPIYYIPDVIGDVNFNGNTGIGTFDFQVYRNTNAVRTTSGGIPYLDRNFTITTTNPPTTPISIRLYFTAAEYAALAAAPGSGISSLSDIRVLKNQDPCGSALTGSTSVITPVITPYGADYVAQFDVSSFSSFYLSGSAAVVPVSLAYFNGVKQTAGNLLNWKIECTSGIAITLERSGDKVNFKGINSQNATADRCLTPFSYTDASPLAGYNYYRLKTVSPDGAVKYSNIVVLINKDKGFEFVSIVPNPVKDNAVLNISSAKGGRMDLQVSDIAGKTVLKQSISVIAGTNAVMLNFNQLGTGTYQVTMINADGESKTTRFVKY